MPHNTGKITSAITLMLVVSIALVCFPAIRPVKAETKIYIRADGTVEGTANIKRNGNVYTFTGDINAALVVEKDNIVVDGGGFTLRGINSSDAGVNMNYRFNVTVRNLQIVGFSYGINLTGSSGCIISNNTVTETRWFGICLQQSSNHNTVTGNTITNSNDSGLAIMYASQNNVLRNNIMNSNNYNFHVKETLLMDPDIHSLTNDIDASNLVDGKPVIYWVNKQDMIVPSDAGYVALINCTNITVQNLDVSRNTHGILLAYTSNSKVTGNTVTSNRYGIQISFCSNNTVTGNTVTGNHDGVVLLSNATDNTISENTIADNSGNGVMTIISSQGNSVYGNTIRNNTDGINIYQAQHNTYSKNVIVNNREHGITGLSYDCNDNVFAENTVSGNNYGIRISGTSNVIRENEVTGNNWGIGIGATNNVLRNNRMQGNRYSFDALSDYLNDVDTSNTVDGKPIIYWINKQDMTVPSDAGYVALINCNQITVENLSLSKNAHSILLVNTTNSEIIGNTLTESNVGIELSKSSNNTISGNTGINNNKGITIEDNSTRNIVSANSLNVGGISVLRSSYNQIRKNMVTGRGDGIVLTSASNNVLTGNNMSYTVVGIILAAGSEDNTLRNNRMESNEWNFKIEGRPSVNDVDSSNTVGGKPIIYWVNQTDRMVPSDSGTVFLINCENITVQNCSLMDNQHGVLLAYTNNCTIAGNYIASNTFGIQLYRASGNRISENWITGNWFGIELWGNSQNCEILDNYIAFNDCGVSLVSAGDSIFCGNSFDGNTEQITQYTFVGVFEYFWDNGQTGNYWSNYNGTDNNGDGIGDTAYIINENNQDNHPLMAPAVIPEFPSWTPLLIALVAMVAVISVYRRSLRKQVQRRNGQ